ncbi:NfeD family protein [Snodgrassella gandavensis]|uniref:NfeD family protein n=1 Tax=Snodgrassella gandavensis TaxID=2946698 RepID=UPI001EF5B41A|nr:NfeD family protein [Snodgrassella gandavensis]
MIWCIVALILFVLEMFSGTFYLLVISASLLSAGMAEWLLQTSNNTNALIATVFSIIGITIVRLWQKQHPRENKAKASDDPDYGQTVVLTQPLANGLWQVHYRGTTWQARFTQPTAAKPGDSAQIISHDGNILNLTSQISTTYQE